MLQDRLERERLPETRSALLRGIALTRLPEALEWLVTQVKLGGAKGRAAREALTCIPVPEEIRNSLPEE
jgi:hypothetical protein